MKRLLKHRPVPLKDSAGEFRMGFVADSMGEKCSSISSRNIMSRVDFTKNCSFYGCGPGWPQRSSSAEQASVSDTCGEA
jgi:hypothetical protein